MNAPKNTANGWIQYLFNNGVLNGLSISTGLYYVGERPVNEYSLAGRTWKYGRYRTI
ncbi:hypothetical protein QW060_25665 [Myroides ceti]|uniref:Uncharacterized protein n=1 Tax=Paenimyroides ceti TaxID=395087 RepID=A0ABT8D084_9FLAO|nr:hypothetical protein [Paenimyroides ceti]MDN3710248.1 hypothetical protein [Paenimyroides ceti]